MSGDTCGYETGSGACQNPAGEDGTCWIDAHTPPDYSAMDLRDMDRAEAEQRLDADDFARWENVHDLTDAADERADEFAENEQTVSSVVVDADLSALGTDVSVYGNDLTVYIDADDDRLHDAVERLDDKFGDVTRDDLAALGAADREAIGRALEDILLSSIVAWDGERFDDLPADEPLAIVQTARDAWGLTPTFEAVMKIIAACNEAQEERFEAIDSFRGAQRRGHR
jgi:hypothetical protein